jgi:hypothetical protein
MRCFSLLAVTLVALTMAAAQRAPTASIAGTYQIAVCKLGPCSTEGGSERTLTRGLLVLFTDSLPPLPDSAVRLLRPSYIGPFANACLVVDPPTWGSQTYAGIAGVQSTRWLADSVNPRRIEFDLYRSPDAAHEVTAFVTEAGLAGRGNSWGAGVVAVDWPPDTVVGRRIGPPEMGPCLAASAKKWRELQKQPPPPA